MNELLCKKRWPEYRQTGREGVRESNVWLQFKWHHCVVKKLVWFILEAVVCCSVTSAADQVTSGAMMNSDGFASVIVRKLEIYWCLSRCSGYNHLNDLIITSAGCVVIKTSLPDEVDSAPGQRGLCACENLSVTGPLSNSVCCFAEQIHLSVHLCQPQTFPSCLRLIKVCARYWSTCRHTCLVSVWCLYEFRAWGPSFFSQISYNIISQ